jgi:hypothetical protein
MFHSVFYFLGSPALLLVVVTSLAAQDLGRPVQPPRRPATALPALDYPDSASGLEHLVKEIIKAEKENDGDRAHVLLESLVLRNPREWYDQVFGVDVAETPESLYEKSSPSIPSSMAHFFLNAQSENMNQVQVVRFDKSCDDNAGEDAFGILHARLQPLPLYELRLLHGDKFLRLFAFAFVDGSFRYIITPKMDGKVFAASRPKDSSTPTGDSRNAANSDDLRLRVGGTVQAAKLLNRAQPLYPEVARRERLQGTVKMHALIGKDGSLRKLYVIKGYCSLAESSLSAVSHWRYSPTLINAQPVEVDTEIDVVFSLQY